MSIYVMSDIHGMYDLFNIMLKHIKFTEDDKLYILGDVLDRGPKPIELLLDIMDRSNVELLLGNHEQMFLNYLKTGDPSHCWDNGGKVTTFQYDCLGELDQNLIKQYLEGLRAYVEIEDSLLLTHAGFVYPLVDLCPDGYDWEYLKSKQVTEDMIWVRNRFIYGPRIKERLVIYGHTPVLQLHAMPKAEAFIRPGKINIDCAACFPSYNGRLACINLSEGVIHYADSEGVETKPIGLEGHLYK